MSKEIKGDTRSGAELLFLRNIMDWRKKAPEPENLVTELEVELRRQDRARRKPGGTTRTPLNGGILKFRPRR